jgi:tetratricopeptide (TPR) repeat protein
MTARLRGLLIILTFLASAKASANMCTDALNRFDYPAARAIAQGQLARDSRDAPAWICLARSLYETGHFGEALAALNRTDALTMDSATRVLADNWYGVTLRRLNRRAEAWERLQAALTLARQSQDQAGLATALHNTAGLLYDAGQADAALEHYRQSLAINPDAAERSASLNNMGLIEADRGNPALAAQFIEAAIALNRQHGHFHHLGKHLMNLGNLYRSLNRLDEAEALNKEGAALVNKADDRFWIAVSHRLAAWLALDRGRLDLVKSQLESAIKDYALAGAPLEEAESRAELTQLLIQMPTRQLSRPPAGP